MKLRDWLHKNGIKQYQFALRIGCSPPVLSRIINGSQLPDLRTAWDIERATKGQVPTQSYLSDEDAAQ